MPLSAGQMLSHYEILGTLGAGAMGVVFRARDTRLEREVALKVLPGAMVANKEHLARFEREAKLLASLNHPNVATIYDVDHVDGVWFITLELVPGETLRDRLAKGPLLLTEAVHIAREIAAGLQAAHETKIVHRDLKPANIILRPDGHVKILDFGLAKRTDVGGDSAAVELTQQYQILGTPGYLSPEQARGEAADQRADIWAFGCILFECLAGQKAFRGETVGETIRATFEHIPDFETLPPKTPHALRVLLSRCLSKDSKDRLRDIADVRILLEGAVDRSISMVSGPIVITQPAKSTRALVASLVAAVLVAGTLAFFLIRGSSDVARAPAPTG
ncbi:MAG: serine/threonine-protein kinase, partial [Planctomycetota bacterium]|nr:serine/threonine-protein kinase [Planctomycetota bacterium]